MSEQPEALRLADALTEKEYPPRRAAADELRRLHAENEDHIQQLRKEQLEVERLHRVNAQLLEALGNLEEYSKRMGNVASNLAANQMPKHLNASYEGDEGDDLYTGEQLRAAVAAEREACAKLCDEMESRAEGTECCKWPTPADCAYAIRARGEK